MSSFSSLARFVSTTTISPIESITSGLSFLSNALANSPASSISLTYCVCELPLSYIPLTVAQLRILSKILDLDICWSIFSVENISLALINLAIALL